MPVPTLISQLSTSAGTNSPQDSESVIIIDDYIRALSAFTAQLRDGIGFSGAITPPTALRIGGGTLGIIGTRTSGGSGLTPSSACDDIVIDSGIDAGLTVLSGAANFSRLAFGTAASPTSGRVQYDNAAQALSLWASNAEAVRVSTTGNVSIGRTSDGGTQLLVDRLGTGTIPTLSAGTVAVFAGCSLPGSPSVITMIAGNTSESGVRFGDTDADDSGEISYNHATETMTLSAGGAPFMSAASANVTFQNSVVANGGFASKFGLGYTIGAGGTVTQATSKSTAVTINEKYSGRITMNGAALAGGAAVSFTFNNSRITEEFTAVIVNIRAGAATPGAYTVQAEQIANGNCLITLRNTTAGSLSEAVVLTWALLDTAQA